jgi:hypothetical protein
LTALTAGQIQAQVSAIRKRIKNGAQSFAILSPEVWDGPDRLQIDGIEHLVMSCVSDLQAREALLRAGEENKPAVLLCALGSDKLGDDVIARLAKRRVFTPQTLDILTELFSVRIVDPRVLSTKALVEALLDRVPVAGYKPVAGGALDLQQAWEALLEQILGVSIDGPSLSQMLEWSLDVKKIKALADLNPLLKQSFIDWFARTRGEAIRFMMAAIDTSVGAGLIPLGLTLELVFSPEMQKQSEYHAARARLEKYFGSKDIDPESAGAWFRAAQEVFLPLLDEPNILTVRNLVKGVDALLADLKLQEFAYLSNYSSLSLAMRFDRLGKALQEAVKAKSSADNVRICLTHIRQHALSNIESDRLDRVEMAFRLIFWLKTMKLPSSDAIFPDLMDFYSREGGFLEWARNRLRETDVSGPVQAAFQQILQEVDEHLVQLERRFAEKLAGWSKAEQQSTRLILIEDLLLKAVVPVSKEQPALLLVLDGMSAAVFRQLMRDFDRQGWTQIANNALGLPRPVLATLPSVTQISRRALFLGKLDLDTPGTEKAEFSGNEFLFRASGSQVRPKLFLKGNLQAEGHTGLAAEVRSAISDKKCRVVGVVVNAIDDHLDSGDQVAFTWGLDRIKPLRELLKLAADSERLILMTSDHGHVLDAGSHQFGIEDGDSGDRYRTNVEAIKDGEMLFESSRVKEATGQTGIVLAWRSDVRYATKKRGYHGGANPQEMVVPFAILSGPNSLPPSGWEEIPHYEPEWWRIAAEETTIGVTGAEEPKKTKIADAVKGLELFEQAESKSAEASQTWIDALLDSKIYLEQLKLAVRGGPQREMMTTLIKAIDARGGSIMKPSLAQTLGVPLFRMDGLIQNISRILNVDGYDVLGFDRSTETISLNIKLLKTQFEIE